MRIRWYERLSELSPSQQDIIDQYEEEATTAMVYYDTESGKWMIETECDDEYFESPEEMIDGIKYCFEQWEVEEAREIARQIAEEESRHNAVMEDLMTQLDNLNVDHAERYDILERARMAL
jgi:hypothetical protein